MLASQTSEQSLVNHLEARLANSEVERALGGFALLLIRFRDHDDHFLSLEAADTTGLLAAICARIRKTLRDGDFLAQLDDRTFAVVIPQVSDRANAEKIVKKLAAAFALPVGFADNGQGLVLSPKITVSLYPSDGTTQQSLIAFAEEAM